MEGKRVYSDIVDIKTENVKEFYNKRAKNIATMECPYTAVLLGDQNPEYAEKWNTFEKELVLPKLNISDYKEVKVLDIGCGFGRWAELFIPISNFYYGVDYSEDMIKLAKERNCNAQKQPFFKCMSFQELTDNTNQIDVKFNVVLMCGVSMYINDIELKECFKKLNGLLDEHCVMYFTETIAASDRLTLDSIYSENLKSQYDAIYRTANEYNQLYEPLLEREFKIIEQGYLPKYNKEEKFKETDRWYTLFKR